MRQPVILDPERNPWDRQPGESARQHERFLRYRDAGRMRSLTEVNKTLTALGDKLTYGTIRTQSHLYRWAERAAAWDHHEDELDRENLVKARREMVERHRRVAGALLQKALSALRDTSPKDLDPADIIRWVKLATDLEARVLGMPERTVGVTGPTGGPVQAEDLSTLSREERAVRMREIMAEIAGRTGMGTTVDD